MRRMRASWRAARVDSGRRLAVREEEPERKEGAGARGEQSREREGQGSEGDAGRERVGLLLVAFASLPLEDELRGHGLLIFATKAPDEVR